MSMISVGHSGVADPLVYGVALRLILQLGRERDQASQSAGYLHHSCAEFLWCISPHIWGGSLGLLPAWGRLVIRVVWRG